MPVRISAKSHFTRGLDFIYLSDNRLPHGYEKHSHDYIEIVVVVEGKATHRINGIAYDAEPGDVCVLQGHTEHAFENTSAGFRIINIMYVPEKACFPLRQLCKMPGYQALFVMEPAQRLGGEFKSKLRLDALALSEILGLDRRMEEELFAKRPGFESILHALLLETVATLSREYSKSSELGAQKMLRMGEAVSWLEANYASEISLPKLAKMAALSERQFLRLFRKLFGHSPIEHLLRIRLNAAAQMLRSEGCSVSEAAFAGGYHDSSYFTRQFKKLFNAPPKRIRALKEQSPCIESRRSRKQACRRRR